MRILGLIAIFAVGMSLTALLTVAWMLLLAYGKKKKDDMEGEDWDVYFREIPVWGYVVRGLTYLVLALWVTVPLLYGALGLFRYENRAGLCLLFAVLTVAAVAARGFRKRKYLLERLDQLRQTEN